MLKMKIYEILLDIRDIAYVHGDDVIEKYIAERFVEIDGICIFMADQVAATKTTLLVMQKTMQAAKALGGDAVGVQSDSLSSSLTSRHENEEAWGFLRRELSPAEIAPAVRLRMENFGPFAPQFVPLLIGDGDKRPVGPVLNLPRALQAATVRAPAALAALATPATPATPAVSAALVALAAPVSPVALAAPVAHVARAESTEWLRSANFGRLLPDPLSIRPRDNGKRQRVLLGTLRMLDIMPPGHFHALGYANLKRWETGSKMPPRVPGSRCDMYVWSYDWGDAARELTKLYGKTCAVLNMANAFCPGGGYVEGSVAQEENMFRRTDCHYSISLDDMNIHRTKYVPDFTKLLGASNGQVYLDMKSPRVCVRGPEDISKLDRSPADDIGYEWLPANEIFLFYELRAAAVDLRPCGTRFDPIETTRRVCAMLDTLIHNGVRHVVLSAFGCGAYVNPCDKVAAIFRRELESRSTHFDAVAFGIYACGYGPGDNYDVFVDAFRDWRFYPIGDEDNRLVAPVPWALAPSGIAPSARALHSPRVRPVATVRAPAVQAAPAALLLSENFGRLLPPKSGPFTAGDFGLRQRVLLDTLSMFDHYRMIGLPDHYHKIGYENLKRWKKLIADQNELPLVVNKKHEGRCRVYVWSDDWGVAALKLTKRYGKICAVLNMANAFGPGGGYVDGMVAQEENMFRRTDCHFSVSQGDMMPGSEMYRPALTDLLNATDGLVYLDTDCPRVCVRGPEDISKLDRGPSYNIGYKWLKADDIFPFYELRAAAVDLRWCHGSRFDPIETKKRVSAMLDTLITAGVRHVVLGAFGCGAFMNPSAKVAQIFRDELECRSMYFDAVAFGIFYSGYGPATNYNDFLAAFSGWPLSVP